MNFFHTNVYFGYTRWSQRKNYVIEGEGFWYSIIYQLYQMGFTCASTSWKEYINWLNIDTFVFNIFFGPIMNNIENSTLLII